MSKFVILFRGKEGSTALVEFLQNFKEVSMVGAVKQPWTWEPFDAHNRGAMSMNELAICLELIFKNPGSPLDTVNQLYLRSAKNSLVFDPEAKIIGLKMRFSPPQNLEKKIASLSCLRPLLNTAKRWDKRIFTTTIFKLFRKYNVVVFVLIRKDILRWALSKYHGDGYGNQGHLQFRLASGELAREAIPKIHVDPVRLGSIIKQCEKIHFNKVLLLQNLGQAGIRAFPLFYESFLYKKTQFFQSFFNALGQVVDEREIAQAIETGSQFQKVHSEDISSFVINYEEIMDKFGSRLSLWGSE